MKNGKIEGNGYITYLDKRIYQGELKAGKREGQGLLLWPFGKFYEGRF